MSFGLQKLAGDTGMERKRIDDYEPGPIPSPKALDRFGFIKQEFNAYPEGLSKSRTAHDHEREERRVRKWRKMIGIGGSDWKHYVRRKPNVVKRRIRKGIPDCLRGLVWQLISGSRDLLLMNPGVYEQLVIYETSASELDIIRDISRTFPSHVFFQQRHGPGQRSLYNVLKAYSVYDRDVGYVQGMGFLAGLLLLYMSEEDAFWLMVALLKGAVHAPMEGLYLMEKDQVGVEASSGRKDPGWKYARLMKEEDANTLICIFCDKVTKGGIYRLKQHLVGGFRNSTKCRRCPEHVVKELADYMSAKKAQKNQMGLESHSVHEDLFGCQDEENEEATSKLHGGFSSGGSNVGGSIGGSKRQKGPMDRFFTPKSTQSTINNAYKKEVKERADLLFCRWMYEAAIPFNAVNYDSFQPMLEAIGQYGVGYKGPSFHEVRVTNLKKELALTKDLMKDHFSEWRAHGCSIMSDGWTDRKERTLVNFLVNSSKGTMFMKSIDASSMIKTGDKLFHLLDSWVEEVGEDNVVQVITDNASSYVMAGRFLEMKRPNLYWTPCAAHCLDLMLEDIGKLPNIKKTIERAISISGYIYNRAGLLNMMRRFTEEKELLRPAKTRFATAFITLSRFYEQRNNLRRMFISDDWTSSKWAKEQKGKNVANIVLMTHFWNTMVFALKVSGPLVRVLRLVDGEKKPPMGYIYAAMKKAKETIIKSFNGNEEKYEEIMKIIDRRWEVQLHRPLHAAGYFLNPEFFYETKELGMSIDEKIMEDLFKCISRLVKDSDEQDLIISQLDMYMGALGLFGNPFAIRSRKTKSPAEWWAMFGNGTKNLQKFALKILNLTCSASGCERNWSIFENIHSKRRNRLGHQRLNDLVYIKYNRALMKRYNDRHTIDPITLNDIDESNEWLMGRMEGDENANDDLVFEDDDLTWSDVAKASGAQEPIVYTRAKASSSKIPTSKSSPSISQHATRTLIDEDEDMIYQLEEEDEEEGEWKCDNEKNDDNNDDFVDLSLEGDP